MAESLHLQLPLFKHHSKTVYRNILLEKLILIFALHFYLQFVAVEMNFTSIR